MTVVAVAGPKGGIGKTTLTLNLAYSLARRGWRTLLVDADPQGSIGLSLTGRAKDSPGLAEALAGAASLEQAVLPTRLAELHLLPAGNFPGGDPDGMPAGLAHGSRLNDLVAQLAPSWDAILVDCPSGLGGMTKAVLAAASHLLCPLQAEPLALRSVPRLLEALAALRREGRGVTVAGFVLTMLQSRDNVSLAVAHEAWRLLSSDLVLETTVPRDPVFLEASAKGVPVGLLDRRPPPVAAVFDQLAAELEPRIGLKVESRYDQPLALLD